MAFLTRWVRGSPIRSMTVLSSSVSSPTVSSTACLPTVAVRSRTSRGKREKSVLIGSMRTASIRS